MLLQQPLDAFGPPIANPDANLKWKARKGMGYPPTDGVMPPGLNKLLKKRKR